MSNQRQDIEGFITGISKLHLQGLHLQYVCHFDLEERWIIVV